MSEKRGPEPLDEGGWRGKDGRRRYDIEPDVFIRVWEGSESAEEVAEKLKMPRAIVHARATKYRSMGIDLKSMPRIGKGKPVVASRMNSLIGEIRKAKGQLDQPASVVDLSNSAVIDRIVELVIARLLALGIVRLGNQAPPPTNPSAS